MKKNSSTNDLYKKTLKRVKFNKPSIFSPKLFESIQSKSISFYTVNAGFKKIKTDLLFVVFEKPELVSLVYSKTSMPSAPIIWDKTNNRGLCKVIIINAGNANAHTGIKGLNKIETIC